MTEMIYPISEIFTSPQGEGVHSGTLMTFIRTAGCCVGKPYIGSITAGGKRHVVDMTKKMSMYLPIYTEKCTLYDGREFACDTDYRVHKRMTIAEILAEVPWAVKDICLTGGEPLIHDLRPLVEALKADDRTVHLETSGTRPYTFSDGPHSGYIWVTVSPKHGCLKSMIEAADELKFLVDKDFNPEKQIEVFPESTMYTISDLAHFTPTFLQPVNGENEIDPDNLRLCMEWQRKFPQFRLSLQGHKVLSRYIGELVR